MIPFLVIQDYKENARKCTALPLRGFDGVEFLRFRSRPQVGEQPRSIPGGIWLAVDAPIVTAEDKSLVSDDRRVLVLDAAWARLGALTQRVSVVEEQEVVKRSLPHGLVTAYPRRSKVFEDPVRGLATVEAMFAVSVCMGEPRLDFLDTYHWGQEFLDTNREVFESIDWTPPRSE